MDRKEACQLAYNLIMCLADINDVDFVDKIIECVSIGNECEIVDMLEVEEIEY